MSITGDGHILWGPDSMYATQHFQVIIFWVILTELFTMRNYPQLKVDTRYVAQHPHVDLLSVRQCHLEASRYVPAAILFHRIMSFILFCLVGLSSGHCRIPGA